MIAYFMGVWPGDTAGHYCCTPDGRHIFDAVTPSPWGTQYMPLGDLTATQAAWPEHYDHRLDNYTRADVPQTEGVARVLHKDGWTLVSMWDRSGDKRPGSHATFALRAALEPAAAIEAARALFPTVFARIEAHLGRAAVLGGAS